MQGRNKFGTQFLGRQRTTIDKSKQGLLQGRNKLKTQFLGRQRTTIYKSIQGLLQGRNKFITQFLGRQRRTCGQIACKNWINQTFISVEIQTIYKSVLIYQILGPRE